MSHPYKLEQVLALYRLGKLVRASLDGMPRSRQLRMQPVN